MWRKKKWNRNNKWMKRMQTILKKMQEKQKKRKRKRKEGEEEGEDGKGKEDQQKDKKNVEKKDCNTRRRGRKGWRIRGKQNMKNRIKK